jgi:hypothetical protein
MVAEKRFLNEEDVLAEGLRSPHTALHGMHDLHLLPVEVLSTS